MRLTKTLEDAATQSATDEIAGIKVQTRYMTTAGYTYSLSSNPYRANYSTSETDPTMGWTRSKAVNTGRHAETETFSGSGLPAPWGSNASSTGVVQTDVDTNAATVTDQAGKLRRSITNGIGQLTRVDEPTTSGLGSVTTPNQSTNYAYDTLNNLTTVTQGVQTRTFAYSSLSRLTSAANPESGTINYLYDNNGNLTSKTDAKPLTTTFVYDALNRITQRSYSDSGITPVVNYTYDNLTNAKGRLTKVASTVSTTEYIAFDILGRVTQSKQTTDATAYTTGYTYNLSGALNEETYPSGRVVKNVLNPNGDLSIVQSKKNSTAGYFNYAKNLTYSAAGAVTSMQLGNGKWESTVFNSRLQPEQIALGTVQNGYDKLKLNYTYGGTANNGNVQTQTITVPGLSQPFIQTYAYDSLNRLSSATETNNGSPTWSQVFGFDRYGNRNITSGVGQTNLTFSGNRITTAGYSFDLAGNTTADPQGRTFAYDAENKQTAVNNGSTGQYSYDGQGKRVKKYVPASGETTIFVYDAAGKQIAEYSTIVYTGTDAKVAYTTADHLGSPRITTDANGAVISRRDFHPFGEEVFTAQRTTGLGYSADTVRQKFTSYERDNEDNLDFAQARYYNSQHGRFTSTDPLLSSGRIEDPQSWNRYSYVLNNPLDYVDPLGLYECGTSLTEKQCQKFEQTRLDLGKARDQYQKKGDTTKADSLSNTLKAIGTLNDKNGLTIEIGKVSKGAAAETSFGLTTDGKPLLAKDADGKGNYVANVIITFKSSDEITLDNLAHEGSHAEDRQKLVAAIFAEGAKDPSFDDEKAKALPQNLTKYATESKAYHNSSYIQEYTSTEGEYWKRGWKEADRQTAIDRTLRTSDLYKVTPKDQGNRLYETIKKP